MSRSFSWRHLFGGMSDAADAAAYAFEGVADQLKAVEGSTRAITNTPPTPLRRGDTFSFTTTFTTGDQMPANPNVGDLRTDAAGRFEMWDGKQWQSHDPHQGQPTMRAGGCKQCGDPADHHGDPHPGRKYPDGRDTHYGSRRGQAGVRGLSPSMMTMDEIAFTEEMLRRNERKLGQTSPPRLPLMDPTLSAVLLRRPCKIEVHSDDAEWLEDQLLNHRIPSAQVTPMLLDGEAGPDSADVEVTELVEPGTVRAHYWTPVRNVFTLEHETEYVDVVIR